ncbi:hypothetical protein HYH03_014339 [Edaphochlamys debaryana]|uniref:MRN complex-interacting protein N-terminal domain-containing protein n=1 Tax=Edaphochlamys debaryana TaxID=47281 RepID=A0A835XRL5_9CHLO|nr:hypothetical protein HYH03_014339 [Edaphochlamys debaryana]|eukprot:KAG2486966.1 hypothetical protein HYH03_014339 [Edaphochlamys debaryana]
MPQTFQCVKCVACNKFQVQQVKKVQKFSCAVCGTSQTIQHVYAIGDRAKDVRLHVQRLNQDFGDALDAAEEQTMSMPERGAQRQEALFEPTGPSQRRSEVDWSEFAEAAPEPVPDDDGFELEGNFVTVMPDRKRGPGQAGRRGGGRANKLQRSADGDDDLDPLGPSAPGPRGAAFQRGSQQHAGAVSRHQAYGQASSQGRGLAPAAMPRHAAPSTAAPGFPSSAPPHRPACPVARAPGGASAVTGVAGPWPTAYGRNASASFYGSGVGRFGAAGAPGTSSAAPGASTGGYGKPATASYGLGHTAAHTAQAYGTRATTQPYGAPAPTQAYGAPAVTQPYRAPAPSVAASQQPPAWGGAGAGKGGQGTGTTRAAGGSGAGFGAGMWSGGSGGAAGGSGGGRWADFCDADAGWGGAGADGGELEEGFVTCL